MNANSFLNGLSETLAKKAKEIGGQAEGFVDRQKTRGQILVEKREIDKIRQEIGDVVFKSYKAGEELSEELKALCEEIDLHQDKIADMESDIADNQGKRICPSCQAKVEKDAVYCPSCGEPLPVEEEDTVDAEDLAEAAEDAAEAVADAAEDAFEAAKDAAEDAVDAVKDAAEDAVDAVKDAVEDVTE